MTAWLQPDLSARPVSSWLVRQTGAVASVRGQLAENAEGERIIGTARCSAVVTPVDGVDELVTTLDAALGVVTSGAFGRVVGYAHDGQRRLDVHLLSPNPAMFSFAHNYIRADEAASVEFADDCLRVHTALMTAERRRSTVRVALAQSDRFAVHDQMSGQLRAFVAGGRRLTARVGARSTTLSVKDEVSARVIEDGMVEVRQAGCDTVMRLDVDTRHVELVCVDGVASVLAAVGVTITCVRSGWRVSADGEVLTVEATNRNAGLRWERSTMSCTGDGDLSLDGVSTAWSERGLEIDLGGDFVVVAGERVHIKWCGNDFLVGRGHVLVADEENDWYLGANGHLGTSGCIVTAGRTASGIAEVAVRSVEHDWFASAWCGGAFVEDGADMRMVLDGDGAVFTPVTRADSSVVSRCEDSSVLVNATTVQVEAGAGGDVRLRSGVAELRVCRGAREGELRSSITCGDLFSVVVTDCARDGLTWRTTHASSHISHLVRGGGELVVGNSPSGSGITATVDEVHVVPSDRRAEFTLTV